MTQFKLAKCILLLAMAGLTGCVGETNKESTGQLIDSSAITLKVKARLVSDDSVKSLPISVKTYKNVVELSGFVDNAEQKQRAADDASQVEGVKAVRNALLVKGQ